MARHREGIQMATALLPGDMCHDRDGGRAGGRGGDLLVFIKETRDRL